MENINPNLICNEKPNYKKIDKEAERLKETLKQLEEWKKNKEHLDFHKYGKIKKH